MVKHNKKYPQKSDISTKKKVLISANVFYFFLVLGFVFTTNIDNPVILHKYTLGYIKSFIGLVLLVIPYNLLILFLLNNTISILIKDKKYKYSLFWRTLSVVMLLILVLMLTELFLRMKPKPFVEDFHPFLQAAPTVKNEGYLHIDSAGFRYDELTEKKPKDVYRIFLLGGSTAFDQPRPYEKSISKVLENALRKHYHNNNIQVINAAYNSYTSEHSLIEYETKIQDYHPDLIVIFQGYNDMLYSCSPPTSPIRTYKNDYAHVYEVLYNVINDYFNWRFQFLTLTRLTKAFDQNFYADIRNRIIKPMPKITYTDTVQFPSLNAYTRNTTDLIQLTKTDHVNIILGNQAIHYNNNPKNYGLAEYFCKKSNTKYISMNSLNKGIELFNNTTKQISQKYDVPFVDIASQIPRTDEYLSDDVHYTDKGDQKVTEALYNGIVSSSFVSSSQQSEDK